MVAICYKSRIPPAKCGFGELNHHPVLGEPFLSDVETDGRRQKDVAEDMVLPLRRLLLPLGLSVPLVRLLGSFQRQPALELPDDGYGCRRSWTRAW